MQPRKKPTRKYFIQREPVVQHVDDDTGHLWAVSYADFLMVLLSFFILFFSVNGKNKDIIIKLVSNMKTQGVGAGEGASSSLDANAVNAAAPSEIIKNIEKKLENIKFEVSDKTRSVTFTLADNIYRQGSIVPSDIGRESLLNLISLLDPYKSEIDIIFVGHTDSIPIKKDKIVSVENNFDLSALRAASALKIALQQGIPKSNLFIHGSADNSRVSKSLSVIVKAHGEGSI